jgi:hypothetical protein
MNSVVQKGSDKPSCISNGTSIVGKDANGKDLPMIKKEMKNICSFPADDFNYT